jgi:hypothetical protein
MPTMLRARLVVIESEFILGGFKAVFDGPTIPFDLDQLCYAGSGWHQVVKKAMPPSAIVRRIKRCPPPFVPSPVDGRCQTGGSKSRAISSAVLATGGLLFQEPN